MDQVRPSHLSTNPNPNANPLSLPMVDPLPRTLLRIGYTGMVTGDLSQSTSALGSIQTLRH